MFGLRRLSIPDYKKFRFRILVFRIFGFARAVQSSRHRDCLGFRVSVLEFQAPGLHSHTRILQMRFRIRSQLSSRKPATRVLMLSETRNSTYLNSMTRVAGQNGIGQDSPSQPIKQQSNYQDSTNKSTIAVETL